MWASGPGLEANSIYARTYTADPEFYTLMRSLDTLDTIIGSNARIILRTDAAPFRILVDGPNGGSSPVAPLPEAGR